MDLNIREVLEGAKELRVASEQLVAKTQLLQARAARLTEKNRWVVMEGAELRYDSPVCVTRLDDAVCPMPPVEERVQRLCRLEEETVDLVQQLRAILLDIEQLRGSKSSEALGESNAPW